jgi:hypothetical protein
MKATNPGTHGTIYITLTFTKSDKQKIVFTTNNACKIGSNVPSYRLRCVSNIIEKVWVELTQDSFKLNASIYMAHQGLLL